MSEPRRILVDWEYGASGLAWCLTKKEHNAPSGQWSYLPELSRELSEDLQAWNDSWDEQDPLYAETLPQRQEEGRLLAIRVQQELGTDGWEVLYKLDGQVRRVQPPGSWPVMTWREELLGYAPRDPRARAEEEARILEGLRDGKPQTGEYGR